MANERFARLEISIRQPVEGDYIGFSLDGVPARFTAVNRFSNYNPATEWSCFFVPDNHGVALADAIRAALQLRGSLPYLVSSTYDAVKKVSLVVVQATVYDVRYNFDNGSIVGGTLLGGVTTTYASTRVQVQVVATMIAATIFGSRDGAIQLVATGDSFDETPSGYTYAWADDLTALGPNRQNLAAGTYACTVTNVLLLPNGIILLTGASTTVQVVVTSDARLEVLINHTGNNVTLVPSGGRPPYAYQWQHGPTTASLENLPVGTYTCTVMDSRGATRVVTFAVDAYRFYWSQNPVTLDLDAGAAYRLNPAIKPNLSFVCEVWVEETYLSGTFVQIGATAEQPADRAGRTVFEAQALLDGYLSDHLPAVNQAVPSRADALFRRFYFRYAEKYGAVPATAPFSALAQHYVVFGGLDFYEEAAGTWFNSYQAGAKPFLTWEPNDKAVLPTQPEYLYFMPDSFALATFQVQVRVRYADGTAGKLLAATVANVRRFEVYCLPAGYHQLGLAEAVRLEEEQLSGSARAVVGWEVWVSDAQGVAQTERRRYRLDTRYVAKPRFFLYTNSLGGVNTLACTGHAKAALDLKVEEADRPLGAGYNPLLGDTLATDKSGVLVLSVSSGPLRRAQLVAAQDFLLSKRVTLQTDEVYFAGRVKAKSVPLADELPGDLNTLDFDFLLPRQRLFGPRLPRTLAGGAVVPISGGEGAQP